MSGSFRNIFRAGDKSASEPESTNKLSIGLRPDGFVFAILNESRYKYTALESYLYTGEPGTKDFLHHLKILCDNNPLLTQSFSSTHIAFFSDHLVLIPNTLYDAELKEAYFSLCTKVPDNQTLRSDRMNNLNARGLYAVPNPFIQFFEDRFPGFKLRHQGVVLIENTLVARKLEPWQANVILHVKSTCFEMLVFNNNRLLCYKSFRYSVFDDLLYFVFHLLEQYQMDADRQHLLILGEIGMDTAEYEILNGFFKKVSFAERNDSFRYGTAFDSIPDHYFYNLLNLVTCA